MPDRRLAALVLSLAFAGGLAPAAAQTVDKRQDRLSAAPHPSVTITAPAPTLQTLVLVRFVLPPGRQHGKVDPLIRKVLEARPGTAIYAMTDPVRGDAGPSDAQLLDAARHAGAHEAAILTVERLQGCFVIGLNAPLPSTFAAASVRLRRLDTRSGRIIAESAIERYFGGPFAVFGDQENEATTRALIDDVWAGRPPNDADAREGFGRSCATRAANR